MGMLPLIVFKQSKTKGETIMFETENKIARQIRALEINRVLTGGELYSIEEIKMLCNDGPFLVMLSGNVNSVSHLDIIDRVNILRKFPPDTMGK